jgi:hypothetical protein
MDYGGRAERKLMLFSIARRKAGVMRLGVCWHSSKLGDFDYQARWHRRQISLSLITGIRVQAGFFYFYFQPSVAIKPTRLKYYAK